MPVPKGIRHQPLQALDRSICKPDYIGKNGRRAPDGSEVTLDVLEFINAIRSYREQTGKAFLSFSEILSIARSLGYEKPSRTQRGSRSAS